MKKIICIVLVVLMSFSLLGCKKEENDALTRIKEEGKITIATEGCWAPFTYIDDNGDLVGFDVEVAQAIANELGVKAEFITGEFNGLLTGVEMGRYDIMANGIEYTEERAKNMYFSEPYMYSYVAVVIRADDTSISKFEDLKGKITANTLQSTYAQLAEKYGATVTGVDDFNQTIELLKAKRIDATLNADTAVYEYLKVTNDTNVKVACLTAEPNNVVVAMKKDQSYDTLKDAINKAIEALRANGTLAAISNKYFGTDCTSK